MSAQADQKIVIPSDPQMHRMAEKLGRSLMRPVARKSAGRVRSSKRSKRPQKG